jgi:hypothetical protein
MDEFKITILAYRTKNGEYIELEVSDEEQGIQDHLNNDNEMI